jgi:hypothetical protein
MIGKNMNYVIARIKEPSTWTALGAIGLLLGLPPGTMDAMHMIVGGVAALVGVLLPEGKSA